MIGTVLSHSLCKGRAAPARCDRSLGQTCQIIERAIRPVLTGKRGRERGLCLIAPLLPTAAESNVIDDDFMMFDRLWLFQEKPIVFRIIFCSPRIGTREAFNGVDGTPPAQGRNFRGSIAKIPHKHLKTQVPRCCAIFNTAGSTDVRTVSRSIGRAYSASPSAKKRVSVQRTLPF